MNLRSKTWSMDIASSLPISTRMGISIFSCGENGSVDRNTHCDQTIQQLGLGSSPVTARDGSHKTLLAHRTCQPTSLVWLISMAMATWISSSKRLHPRYAPSRLDVWLNQGG